MGRTVFCEEHLINVFDDVNGLKGFVPGLIIGQFTGQKDYVVHLPKTRLILPEIGENEETKEIAEPPVKLNNFQESILAEHARTVTRMLSGGLWVLGYYIISPDDIFADKNSITKLKTLAQAVYNCTKANPYLCGRDPSNQILIFNFCSLSKKYSCKCMDMTSLNSSFKPATWKFKTEITNWQKVDCRFNLNWLPPFLIPSNKIVTKKKFQEVLAQFQKHLDKLFFSIDGQFSPSDKTLVSCVENDSDTKTDDTKDSFYELMLYECQESIDLSAKLEKAKRLADNFGIMLGGVIGSRVFLNDKSTVEDAFKAVKEDLLRSLAARFEMHWQTCEESEDFNNGFRLRYPPRRILFAPGGSEISYFEYIFEGETERDGLATLCENLGFHDGDITALEDVWEIPSLQSEDNEDDIVESDKISGKPLNKKSVVELKSSNNALIYGIIAAGICLLFSMAMQFLT